MKNLSTKRLFWLLSILVVLALVAAQCGGTEPVVETATEAPVAEEETPATEEEAPATEEEAPATEEEAPATEEEAPATEEEPMAEEEPAAMAGECTDPLGCVEVAAGDAIRISTALVTSGPNETLGIDSQNGVEIAIADRGDILGFPIELQTEDAGCSPEGGQTAAQKIASDESIVAVVGHNCSSSCTPAAPIYADAGLTMISPSCTAPALTDQDSHAVSFLRTAHNDNVQGRVMAEYVYNELGLQKAATIHDGSPYAEQLQQVFADVFAELGGEITAQEAVNIGDTDMRPVLTSIAAGEPEFLYYPIFIAEGGFITTQAKEIAGLEDVILAGADGMISPDFIAAAGEAAEGMRISGPDLNFAGGTYQEFLDKHQEMFGGPPPSAFHAHAYDAANMIFDAIEAVAQPTADGGLQIGREALQNALYATTDFQGITGNLSCNANGDCADPKIAVNEIIDGEYVPVYGGGATDMEAEEAEAMDEMAEEEMAEGEEMTEEAPVTMDDLPEVEACDDPLGCVTVAPDEPIRLASALVTSGPNAAFGVDAEVGTRIAAADRPELLGHPVEIQYEDSQCNAEGGQIVAQKLASDESIVGVVGHSCSSSCTPAAPIYNDAGLTMISPSCTAPSLTTEGTHIESFLRTAYNDNVQGKATAEYVYNVLGVRKAATVHDGSPYSEQLQQVFADVFIELGGEITSQEAINVGDTDMRPVLTSIAAGTPDFIFFPVFVAEGGFMATQAKEISGLEEVILAGADALISPKFLEAAGEAAEGMYISGPDLNFASDEYDTFVTKYEELTGGPPDSAFHAHAYDATNIIMDTIETIAQKDADGNILIGRQALRDALYALENYQGLTGNLTCNELGDCADPQVAINIVQDGEFIQLEQ